MVRASQILAVGFAVGWLAAMADSVPEARASVHRPELCWIPDVEFPVPCDDDED